METGFSERRQLLAILLLQLARLKQSRLANTGVGPFYLQNFVIEHTYLLPLILFYMSGYCFSSLYGQGSSACYLLKTLLLTSLQTCASH